MKQIPNQFLMAVLASIVGLLVRSCFSSRARPARNRLGQIFVRRWKNHSPSSPTICTKDRLAHGIRCRIPADLHAKQLEQVLVNLYLNAIVAMPNGGNLWVNTKIESPIDGAATGVIEVKDTGSGIKPHDLPKIFDNRGMELQSRFICP